MTMKEFEDIDLVKEIVKECGFYPLVYVIINHPKNIDLILLALKIVNAVTIIIRMKSI